MKLFAFQLGGDLYGIEADYVHRVQDEARVAGVCLTPDCYAGLFFYRGEMYDVVDLAALRCGEKTEIGNATRLILLKWAEKRLAVVTGPIEGLIWTADRQDSGGIFTTEGRPVRVLTPRQIWKEVLDLSYGPRQI